MEKISIIKSNCLLVAPTIGIGPINATNPPSLLTFLEERLNIISNIPNIIKIVPKIKR